MGFEHALGSEHPQTLLSVNNMAVLYYVQSDWARAAELWRRTTSAIAAREPARRSPPSPGGKQKKRSGACELAILGLVKTVYRLAQQGSMPDAKASPRCFRPRNGPKALRQRKRSRKWRRAVQKAI